MRRASTLLRENIDTTRVIDRVVLAADERHRRRIMLTGEGGTGFLLDLPQAVTLRDGDGLVLDDGDIVIVSGKPEPVLDIEAANASELARLAWHIGNRHADVQVMGTTLRIRADYVLEKMLMQLGARVTPREAPFDPEPGAYEPAAGRAASGRDTASHAASPHSPGHGPGHRHDGNGEHA